MEREYVKDSTTTGWVITGIIVLVIIVLALVYYGNKNGGYVSTSTTSGVSASTSVTY